MNGAPLLELVEVDGATELHAHGQLGAVALELVGQMIDGRPGGIVDETELPTLIAAATDAVLSCRGVAAAEA